MSYYTYMQGTVKYLTDEAFEKVMTDLNDLGFTDKEGLFLDDCGMRVDSSDNLIDRSARSISIPFGLYRNLCNFDFFPSDEGDGAITVASLDDLVGWVITKNGECKRTDLSSWIIDEMPEDPEELDELKFDLVLHWIEDNA